MEAEAARLGYYTDPISRYSPGDNRSVPHYYCRSPLYPPHVTGSRDGKPLAPLLGRITDYGGGTGDFQLALGDELLTALEMFGDPLLRAVAGGDGQSQQQGGEDVSD